MRQKFSHKRLNANCTFCRVSKQHMFKILIVPLLKQQKDIRVETLVKEMFPAQNHFSISKAYQTHLFNNILSLAISSYYRQITVGV